MNNFGLTKTNSAIVGALVAAAVIFSSPLIQRSTAGDQSKASEQTKPADISSVNVEGEAMSELYAFKEKALDGSEVDFGKYIGDVLLIVNTASACGYTPQYAGLEDLSKKYSGRGLKVLGFPCNQFGGQEPGDSTAIHNFCQQNYGVDFQMFDKVEVNGKNANPLFAYLKGAAPNEKGDIRWNFTKFLVDRKGNVVKRYESAAKPESLAGDIEKLL